MGSINSQVEQAYQWACDDGNFERLQRDIAKNWTLPIQRTQMWPVLERWLIMANPCLIARFEPRYNSMLDCQAGNALMRVMYKSITGEKPRVRSWQIAKQEQEACE